MNSKNTKRITIKSIAQQANVSFSTVAKALHDDPAINEKTRERIKEIARRANYKPNILAKSLRDNKTKFIGMILNDLQSPFYSEIYKAVGDVLNKRGYTMLLSDSSYDEMLEMKNISTMISQGVEGIIISPVCKDSDGIRLLLEDQVKTVFIDNHPSDPNISCVYVDHVEAARLATEYLIQLGHRKILLLNGPEKLPSSQDFRKGYANTLQEHGIEVQERFIKYNPISIDGTCRQIDDIFADRDSVGRDDFTAILALSDVIAIGVYESALQHGFSIPGKYSVIGYDNILATKYLNPPLTTVQQPKEQTGHYAINLLLDQVEKDLDEHRQIILNPELIVRASAKSLDKTK
ncbi:MAG: LacI family transcriptional regulator [Spirochaetaceae bacterium]|nr:LacI family transcriptional regulator [Spirochaetaceae bacterium]